MLAKYTIYTREFIFIQSLYGVKAKRESPSSVPGVDDRFFNTRVVTSTRRPINIRPVPTTVTPKTTTTPAVNRTSTDDKADEKPAAGDDGRPADLCVDPIRIDAIVNAADGGIYVFKGTPD